MPLHVHRVHLPEPWYSVLVYPRCTLFYTELGACIVGYGTETNMAGECYDKKLDKWFKVGNITDKTSN